MPTINSFDYAIVRIVPRVDREEFMNAGVILFCRTARFLGARIHVDRSRLESFAPSLDRDELNRHLGVIPLVCNAEPAGGPISELPLAGRFHWLVAPRSTVIQTSPVHTGLCSDPEAVLERLLDTMVRFSPG